MTDDKFAQELHKKAMRDSIGLSKGTPIKDDRQAKIDKFFEEGPTEKPKKGKHRR
jgi:hypothetical protein